MAELFFGCVTRNPQEVFIWTVISYAICSMATVKKLISQNGSFENTVKFNWQAMELMGIGAAHEYLLKFVTILLSVF